MTDWDLNEYVRQIDEHLGDAANALRGLREHLRRVEEPETPAQDAHTPREQPQTRSGGTDDELHAQRAHPDWEYATTTCGRKQGPAPEPEGDGWEPNAYIDMGADPEGKPYPRRNWERFEYHDEEYWRRRRTPETKETAPKLAISAENASPEGVRLASDQEDEPFVAASTLGGRLRELGARFQRGVSNSDPANDEDIELSGYAYWATVQGIEALAAEVDRTAQTLDGALTSAAVFKEDRDRLAAQDGFQGTTPEQAYGRKHLQREVDALKAIVQDTAQVLDDILGDTQAGMAIEDESETHLRTAQRRGGALDKIGDRILALTDRHRVLEIDGARSKAGGNGEAGA